jgi:hypothetical protein
VGTKIPLRKPQAQKPSQLAGKTVETTGFRGTLPFQAATITSTDGSPVTEALKEEALSVLFGQDKKAEEARAKAIKPPEPVDIGTLSEAKQQEILDAIKGTHVTSTPIQPVTVPPAPVEEPVPPITPPTPTGATMCEHCGWPVGKCDLTDPTPMDKQQFVASILGQKRFYKIYELLGGKIRVMFRTLTTDEMDTVVKQLVNDWNDAKISGPAHSVAEALKYQMALGLQSITTHVGLKDIPVMTDFDYDPTAKETPLPDIQAYVQENALLNESMRRIVSKAYGHFLDTVSKLESMAENADFWSAIEG